jgi:nucleotide-binding universal stress UspA family protein
MKMAMESSSISNNKVDEDVVIKRIVVGVDGSAPSKKALNYAAQWAKALGAELHIVHAIKNVDLITSLTRHSFSSKASLSADELYQSLRAGAAKWMEDFEREAKSNGLSDINTKILSEEGKSEVEMITDYALAVKADMIVVGSRGLSTFKRLVLGSIAGGIVSHALCPVLVVR